MMNILAAIHFAQYFSFAVIISGINPTDHKSTAHHFPHKDFCEAYLESVELQRDNKLVEAEFSILKDDGLNKHHYSVYHFWYMDPAVIKYFFWQNLGTIRQK